jgi:membrane protein
MLSGGLSRAAAAPRRVVRGQFRLVRLSIERFVAMDGFDRSMALAAQAFTTLIPVLIIVAATAENGDGQSLADQLIERFDLSGATAASVQRALPATGTVRDSLSVLSVVILVISALSFTRALQRMYVRAWNLEAHGLRDAPWGLTCLALFALYAILHPGLHGHVPGSFGLVASLAGGAVFWLLTPYVILARRLPLRRLVPQAVLAALGMAALRAGSALYMPRALSSAAEQFGSIGLAFTFVNWLFAAALVLTASAAIGATLSRTVPPRGGRARRRRTSARRRARGPAARSCAGRPTASRHRTRRPRSWSHRSAH